MIAGLTSALILLCPAVPQWELLQDATQIVGYAVAYRLDPAVVAAVMVRESTCRRDAEHASGASGLMGLLHPSAPERADFVLNIAAGVRLLARYRDRCQGDVARTLTAYNRGPGKRRRNCKPSGYSADVLRYQAQIQATVSLR